MTVLRRLTGEQVERFRHAPERDRQRMRLLVVPVWVPGIAATTFGWLVVVRRGHETDDRLLVHELVHVRQWREIGAWRFLTAYLGEYLAARRRGSGHVDAYAGISFEQEARSVAARTLAERTNPR